MGIKWRTRGTTSHPSTQIGDVLRRWRSLDLQVVDEGKPRWAIRLTSTSQLIWIGGLWQNEFYSSQFIVTFRVLRCVVWALGGVIYYLFLPALFYLFVALDWNLFFHSGLMSCRALFFIFSRSIYYDVSSLMFVVPLQERTRKVY
jgi:hypothetical protein